MSLQINSVSAIPEQTKQVAPAAFPKGNLYQRIREELGVFFTDDQFADLFASQGQQAQAPWRLALISVFEFAEGLSDRQTADAVRSRIDWKYALGLELTDAGWRACRDTICAPSYGACPWLPSHVRRPASATMLRGIEPERHRRPRALFAALSPRTETVSPAGHRLMNAPDARRSPHQWQAG